jgi:hypothetical protein
MNPKIESLIKEQESILCSSQMSFGGRRLYRSKEASCMLEAKETIVQFEIDLTLEFSQYLSLRLTEGLFSPSDNMWFVEHIKMNGFRGAYMDFPKSILEIQDKMNREVLPVTKKTPLHLVDNIYHLQYEVKFLIQMAVRIRSMIKKMDAYRSTLKQQTAA